MSFVLGDNRDLLQLVKSSVGTKFISRWGDKMCELAIDAVNLITVDHGNNKKEIDIKRYLRVERLPGGDVSDCSLVKGCMLNKDVCHSKMRRKIEKPRILLLDCSLEYKKGESQTSLELSKEEDFATVLALEEEFVKKMCDDIIKFKPDLVITEKGLSDIAQHYFVKNNITGLRRLRKTDNDRIAKATGATIVSRTDEIKESDIGTGCGLFEVRKIGDEYFAFIEECENPKACTILLRGASKDVLREVERNLQDAMSVAKNVIMDPRLLPGGGATEMSLSTALLEKSKSVEGIAQYPYRSAALAFEVIPRTLAQNCGSRTVRVITELRAKHSQDPQGNFSWGIDGQTGKLVDMNELGVWEPYSVKVQTIKTAVEAACMLLRVDDIVSGLSKERQ
jgi:T-complex protein 1 subunit gamma